MSISAFIAGTRRNGWLEYPHMQVYVRKGYHCIDGVGRHTLDIANVEVQERKRGKGIFTAWLKHAEKCAEGAFEGVFVENLLNMRLLELLLARGYILAGNSEMPSVYKPCNQLPKEPR